MKSLIVLSSDIVPLMQPIIILIRQDHGDVSFLTGYRIVGRRLSTTT